MSSESTATHNWDKVSAELKNLLSDDIYETWFQELEAALSPEKSKNIIMISVKNCSDCTQAQVCAVAHFRDRISHHWWKSWLLVLDGTVSPEESKTYIMISVKSSSDGHKLMSKEHRTAKIKFFIFTLAQQYECEGSEIFVTLEAT